MRGRGDRPSVNDENGYHPAQLTVAAALDDDDRAWVLLLVPGRGHFMLGGAQARQVAGALLDAADEIDSQNGDART